MGRRKARRRRTDNGQQEDRSALLLAFVARRPAPPLALASLLFPLSFSKCAEIDAPETPKRKTERPGPTGGRRKKEEEAKGVWKGREVVVVTLLPFAHGVCPRAINIDETHHTCSGNATGSCGDDHETTPAVVTN